MTTEPKIPRLDQAFLGLTRLPDGRWRLPVDTPICAGTGRLFGGAGAAALTAAIEAATGAHLKVLTVRYLASGRPGDELTGVVDATRIGHTIRADLTLAGPDRPVVGAHALLGEAEGPALVDRSMPHVPAPADCVERSYRFPAPGSLNDRLEVRIAPVRDTGWPSARLWLRTPWREPGSASVIALAADHVPYALAHAPGSPVDDPVVSVDAGLRIVEPPDTDWLLVDVTVEAIADRFAVGRVRIWSREGRLLAVGDQSVVRVRRWSP